jgi:hypothetical protein
MRRVKTKPPADQGAPAAMGVARLMGRQICLPDRIKLPRLEAIVRVSSPVLQGAKADRGEARDPGDIDPGHATLPTPQKLAGWSTDRGCLCLMRWCAGVCFVPLGRRIDRRATATTGS